MLQTRSKHPNPPASSPRAGGTHSLRYCGSVTYKLPTFRSSMRPKCFFLTRDYNRAGRNLPVYQFFKYFALYASCFAYAHLAYCERRGCNIFYFLQCVIFVSSQMPWQHGSVSSWFTTFFVRVSFFTELGVNLSSSRSEPSKRHRIALPCLSENYGCGRYFKLIYIFPIES